MTNTCKGTFEKPLEPLEPFATLQISPADTTAYHTILHVKHKWSVYPSHVSPSFSKYTFSPA